ncbi:uncharacterized protein LOC134804513 isoform X3 [Cydia splendana]|uniref:uncharacterized protein LOC134804513 isoform X3 n=1 Tax=Cydia splendana TaxID=1100963 RepID=UPI00300CD96B
MEVEPCSSYLCLSGVARADTVEEGHDGLHTLLTVCCMLCKPRVEDVNNMNNSPERLAAAQSLHVALGKGLCGARADFCALFSGAEVVARDFVRAARTGHLLRVMAELDHQLVQESFMEGGWGLEFRAAVQRLLTQHAPSEKEAPRTNPCMQQPKLDEALAENMVIDLVVLIGYLVVNNPLLQETVCSGWSVVRMLCTLPANWLVSGEHSAALLPTLAALAAHPPAAAVIRADLSMEMLQNYLESEDAQKLKLVHLIKQGRARKPPGKK